MTSNANMICICHESLFFVQEYVRFLRRWQIASVFYSHKVLSEDNDTYALWVDEKDYEKQTANHNFKDEETQLTKLLRSTKSLIRNLEKSCETNEKLIRANEQLLGFAS